MPKHLVVFNPSEAVILEGDATPEMWADLITEAMHEEAAKTKAEIIRMMGGTNAS